jgi:carboxyl-terminal processing protease
MVLSSVVTLSVTDQISWPFSRWMTGDQLATSPTPNPSISQQSNSMNQDDLDKIETIYQLLEKKYVETIDHDKLISGAISGMVNALEDPYTTYMNETDADKFNEMITSSFTGIGAEITAVDGRIVVVSPIKNSPAEKAGVRPKDIIVSVNGEKLDGLTSSQAVLKVRGPKGTEAKLEIIREGSAKSIFISVIRDEIDLETVYGTMLDNQIGKLEIRQFSTNTATRFKEELALLEDQQLSGLIIDVRNNPGGLVNVVVNIIEQFVPNGEIIVKSEDRDGNAEVTYSKGQAKKYPIVILMNKGSASASEILAAALHDNIGAKLIGETTFGKGTVQVILEDELGDGSNLKVTAYKWLTPKGAWIHKKGIEPDVTVTQPEYFNITSLSKEKTLTANIVSDDVKNMQVMFEALGYPIDRKDGYFSVTTEQIVKDFQKQNQLQVTGEVDVATATKIEEQIVKKIQEPESDLQLKTAIDALQKQINAK